MPLNQSSYNQDFITIQAVKDNTFINQNIDDQLLKITIRYCQVSYLLRILGTGLYTDLQNKILAVTLNSDELFLINGFIQPFLWWKISQEVYLTSNYRVTNIGVQAQSTDYSKPASIDELEALADKAGFLADTHADLLIKHLVANAGLFPAYRTLTSYEDVPPTLRAYNSRIYLGGGYTPNGDDFPFQGGSGNVSGSH